MQFSFVQRKGVVLLAILAMASQVAFAGISIIREDGAGDYTSLAEWEAAEQTDLVSANDSAIARIEGDWTAADGSFTIDGFTTDADHYVRIYTAPDARHNGVWDDTKHRIEKSYNGHGTVVVIRDAYVRLEGLQMKVISTGNGSCNAISRPDGSVSNPCYRTVIAHCILQGDGSGASGGSVSGYSQGNNYVSGPVIYNNIFYNFIVPASGNGTAMGLNRGSQGISVKDLVYNNTIYGCGVGIRTNWSSSVIMKNNVMVGNTIDYDAGGSGPPTTENNITSDTTSPDGASFRSVAVTFVDSANGDLHLDATDAGALDNGLDLSADAQWAFVRDIDGNYWLGTWDAGADECLAADAEVPVVTGITSPAASDVWGTGTAQSITWAATDNNGVVGFLVELSTDSGATFGAAITDTVVTSTASWSDTYAWTVVNAPISPKCLIRVTVYDEVGNAGVAVLSDTFAIVDSIAPVVSIAAPALDIDWPLDASRTIAYSATDNVGIATCSLFISIDNAAYALIDTLDANATGYTWTVAGTETNNAKVQIVAIDAMGFRTETVSDSFTISAADAAAPTVSDIVFTDGSALPCSTVQTVSWTASDDKWIDSTKVYLSYDNGSTWTLLSFVLGDTITCTYNAPGGVVVAQGKAKVIVYDPVGNVDSTISATFSVVDTISPQVTLTAPNGGETWPAEGIKTIEWELATDNIGVTKCSLFYSQDQVAWTPIAEVAAAVVSYDWTLPAGDKPVVYVRVGAYDLFANRGAGESANSFAIAIKPYFTSTDSISLTGSDALSYTITYDQFSIPGTAVVTVYEKPAWVVAVATMLSGTAPDADQVDTVKMSVDVGGAADTMFLLIHIAQASGIAPQTVRTRPVVFGARALPLAGRTWYEVGLEQPGRFELMLYNLRGQKVWQAVKQAAQPGYYSLSGPSEQGALVLLLRQGQRKMVKRVVMVR